MIAIKTAINVTHVYTNISRWVDASSVQLLLESLAMDNECALVGSGLYKLRQPMIVG